MVGYTAYLLLKSIDNYTVEVLITLAVVTGGYALAQTLHTSGPLAVVVAGLFIGNRGGSWPCPTRRASTSTPFGNLSTRF